MKKSKLWINTYFYLLMFVAIAAHSSEIGNPITDDIEKISILKQNIPKDYKITVKFIPMEESGSCWVKLNVFHLEESLKALARKFGNISSNRDHINTFIQILREMRYHIGHAVLDDAMLEFQCHYREEKWPTLEYFEFVEYFFKIANSSREEDEDCESPPCPTVEVTTSSTSTSSVSTKGSASLPSSGAGSFNKLNKDKTEWVFPEHVKMSLLSLLLIPVIAIMLLFAWKIKSRRQSTPPNKNEIDAIKEVDDSSPHLQKEACEEKECLNVIEVIETV